MDMSVNMGHREDAIIRQHEKLHPALHSTTRPIAEAPSIASGIGLSSMITICNAFHGKKED
jgi:hypothetical protein